MLRLLGRATSGNVQKVIFLLEELGLPYRREDYGRQFENTGTAEYLAMNPTGKVPVLLDGDLSIWESHTILRYLATKAGSGLYPSEPAQRTQVERWMDWTLASLNPVFMAGFRDVKKQEHERGPDTARNIAAELALLDAEVAKAGWIAGDAFSLADVALAPVVRRCLAFPYDKPELAALVAWRGRLEQKPAYVTATAAG